jgi:hypothetical protein
MNNECRLKLIDTVETVIGVVIAVVGGVYWYEDYRQRSNFEESQHEMQALETIHQARLQACLEVTDVAAKLFSASNQAGYDKQFDRFTELKHGKALMLLDSSVVRSMLDT